MHLSTAHATALHGAVPARQAGRACTACPAPRAQHCSASHRSCVSLQRCSALDVNMKGICSVPEEPKLKSKAVCVDGSTRGQRACEWGTPGLGGETNNQHLEQGTVTLGVSFQHLLRYSNPKMSKPFTQNVLTWPRTQLALL